MLIAIVKDFDTVRPNTEAEKSYLLKSYLLFTWDNFSFDNLFQKGQLTFQIWPFTADKSYLKYLEHIWKKQFCNFRTQLITNFSKTVFLRQFMWLSINEELRTATNRKTSEYSFHVYFHINISPLTSFLTYAGLFNSFPSRNLV